MPSSFLSTPTPLHPLDPLSLHDALPIYTLLGFHDPSAGTAQIFGHDIVVDAKKIKALIGYMPERDAFISKMSAVHFVRDRKSTRLNSSHLVNSYAVFCLKKIKLKHNLLH